MEPQSTLANDPLITSVVLVMLTPSPWLTGRGSRMTPLIPARPVRLKPRTSVSTSTEIPFHRVTKHLKDKLRTAEGHFTRMWEEAACEQNQ